MLTIDGRQGEGGGQVLRTSLSLSAITGRPFRIEHIRANRSKPGLQPQHLTAVRAVATLCAAYLEGDHLDSTTLTFQPTTRPVGGSYHFDVVEASRAGRSGGSVTLIFQAVLWPLLFADAPAHVTLRGGTQVPHSPPYHYLAEVAQPAFARFGTNVTLDLKAWGWQSAGGGVVLAHVEPLASGLQAADFTLVRSDTVQGVTAVTNLPSHIPSRMERRAYNLLTEAKLRANIQPMRERGSGAGAGLVLWLPQAGFSAVGRPGLPAEQVAETAVTELLAFAKSGAAVDPHLADQLIIPMALASGESSYTTNHLTLHTLTNIELIKQWLDVTIQVKGQQDQPGQVTVQGIGFSRDAGV
jgi:RNA 3'-terminal phosphate cyclase (ATP)